MKKQLLLFLFIINSIVSSFAQANLHFEKDTIDVGTIIIDAGTSRQLSGEYLKVDFPFKNTGDQPIFFSGSSGSGSGIAYYPKNIIKPGDTGLINVTMAQYRFDFSKVERSGLSRDHFFLTGFTLSGSFPEKQKEIFIRGFVKMMQFNDILEPIATDSFSNNLGVIAPVNFQLRKYFKYTGKEPGFITGTWTGDPHYICNYPKGPLETGKVYSFTICFFAEGRRGPFEKAMGFYINGSTSIRFLFHGDIQPK